RRLRSLRRWKFSNLSYSCCRAIRERTCRVLGRHYRLPTPKQRNSVDGQLRKQEKGLGPLRNRPRSLQCQVASGRDQSLRVDEAGLLPILLEPTVPAPRTAKRGVFLSSPSTDPGPARAAGRHGVISWQSKSRPRSSFSALGAPPPRPRRPA